jgi:hypothetical protein
MAFGKKKAKKPKLLRKVAAEDGNALVKTTTARYTKTLKIELMVRSKRGN